MKLVLILSICYLFTAPLFGQATYKGFIGKYPIELVTNIYSEEDAKAFYVYTKYDEPIKIDGTFKNGILKFIEKDDSGKTRATLTFENFKKQQLHIEGVWKSHTKKKELKIKLTKTFAVEKLDSVPSQEVELLQLYSLKDKYFKVIISKQEGAYSASVKGLKIIEKKSDKLLQQFSMEGQMWGLENVSIDDYNFDGFMDFSVFEQYYSGANTSSLYYLYDPKTSTYFKSTFKGTSLAFDKKLKRIYELNQCCAGRNQTKTEYKVVDNNMVFIKKTCQEYDDSINDYKTILCE